MKLKRTCWWCSSKLMAVSHAEVVMPDGNKVWVHKCYEAATRQHFKPLTAAPMDSASQPN